MPSFAFYVIAATDVSQPAFFSSNLNSYNEDTSLKFKLTHARAHTLFFLVAMLIRTFMFLGFFVVPPGNELILPSDKDHVYMVYNMN